MARETFIDTSGFYALLVKRDDMHEVAARVLGKVAKQRARFLKSQACTVDWMNPDRFAQAAAILSKHLDQGYSFTDCVSFATMKARSLRDALTKDDHFSKAGFVALLRSG